MKYARFFSILVLLLVALYGAVGFYFLPLASYQGDLTRIGMLPESLFGWTRAQPAIRPELMRQSSWQEADVLVIGDSFSDNNDVRESRVWQTVLTGHGLRVHTEHWDNIRAVCTDFADWLHAQGFKGRYVVIEVVERYARDRFADSVACNKMELRHSFDEDQPRLPPATAFDHHAKDYSGKLSVGISTEAHQLGYQYLSAQPGFNGYTLGPVRVARVAGGCVLFSHKACRDALFLGEDSGQDLPDSVIDDMETLNARFTGLAPVWAVVPNKSTAYLYPDKDFWDRLERRLHTSVNLMKPLRQAISDQVIDVYPANNTHLSTTGYLLMGDAIYRKMETGAAR
jgi:hypothetical protein